MTAAALLRGAREMWQREPALAAAARTAARGGFAGGAEWMREAIGRLRGVAPTSGCRWWRLGAESYGLALLGAVPFVALAVCQSWWWLAAAVVAFYVVESRMVFAFPLALDGSEHPLRDSVALVRRLGSWPATTLVVMRLAAEMLFGGLFGRGFLRSWCAGCLAVVLWYDAARRTAG